MLALTHKKSFDLYCDVYMSLSLCTELVHNEVLDSKVKLPTVVSKSNISLFLNWFIQGVDLSRNTGKVLEFDGC